MSKEEYETCRITNPSPRVIAVCDKPRKTMYFTITFRPFTPQPGGLEFLPGHDYYFISTSSKDDLHRRIGGRCTSHNMKVVFKVCCDNDTSSSSATSRNNCKYPKRMRCGARIPESSQRSKLPLVCVKQSRDGLGWTGSSSPSGVAEGKLAAAIRDSRDDSPDSRNARSRALLLICIASLAK